MFGSNRFKTIKKQGEIIFKSRFLNNLSSFERYELLQLCHSRNYKEGEYIYYQGDPGTGMYFIEEGKVQLIVEPEPGTDNNEQKFILDAPESFGALSIGYELRRMSSAKCLTDCTLLGFFKPDFETLKKRHPSIAVKFMETLAMLAMKQLEVSTKCLKETTGTTDSFALIFKQYYQSETDNEPL